MRHVRTAALLALAALLLVAPAARADGDPASDYLLEQQVFLPYDDHIPQAQQARIAGLVADANRGGYPIRVAVIASSYDLGSVTALWRKPRLYARFLGVELSFVFKGSLLIVMPNGFGLNHPKHPTAADLRVLDRIPIGAGAGGLAAAATTAVERLAATHGVTAAPRPAVGAHPHSTTQSDRLHLVVGIAVLLVLAAAARLGIRRRQRRRRPA